MNKRTYFQQFLNPARLAPLLISSAIIGPGVRYSYFYLFHLVSIFFLLSILKDKNESVKLFAFFKKNKILWMPFIYFGIHVTALLWTDDLTWGVKKTIISVFGMITFVAAYYIFNNIDACKKMLKHLSFLVYFHLALSLIEIYTKLSWPISIKSNFNYLFGLSYKYIPNHGEDLSVLSSRPTSLFWNINDSAFMTLVIFIFLLYNKSSYKMILIPISSLVVLYSSSRSAILILLSMTALYLFWSFLSLFIQKIQRSVINRENTIAILLAVITIISFKFSQSSYQKSRFKEAINLAQSIELVIETGHNTQIESKEEPTKSASKNIKPIHNSSIDKRILLSEETFKYFLQSPFIGIGTGGLGNKYLKHFHGKFQLRASHNYWLEILTEFGIIAFVLYLLWILTLFRISLSNKSELVVALIVLIFLGGFMLPSLVYFLPMWVVFSFVSFKSLKVR